jgi:hypothetical protein
VSIAALTWPAAVVWVALIVSIAVVLTALIWSIFGTAQTAVRAESKERKPVSIS